MSHDEGDVHFWAAAAGFLAPIGVHIQEAAAPDIEKSAFRGIPHVRELWTVIDSDSACDPFFSLHDNRHLAFDSRSRICFLFAQVHPSRRIVFYRILADTMVRENRSIQAGVWGKGAHDKRLFKCAERLVCHARVLEGVLHLSDGLGAFLGRFQFRARRLHPHHPAHRKPVPRKGA